MASQTAYDAVRDHLCGVYARTYPVLDFDHIEPQLEQSTEVFMALEDVSSTEEMSGFGDQSQLCIRESGVIVIYVFAPSPESSRVLRELLDDVRNNVRYRALGNVRLSEASPPDIDALNNGLWSIGSVALSYDYDFHQSRSLGGSLDGRRLC